MKWQLLVTEMSPGRRQIEKARYREGKTMGRDAAYKKMEAVGSGPLGLTYEFDLCPRFFPSILPLEPSLLLGNLDTAYKAIEGLGYQLDELAEVVAPQHCSNPIRCTHAVESPGSPGEREARQKAELAEEVVWLLVRESLPDFQDLYQSVLAVRGLLAAVSSAPVKIGQCTASSMALAVLSLYDALTYSDLDFIFAKPLALAKSFLPPARAGSPGISWERWVSPFLSESTEFQSSLAGIPFDEVRVFLKDQMQGYNPELVRAHLEQEFARAAVLRVSLRDKNPQAMTRESERPAASGEAEEPKEARWSASASPGQWARVFRVSEKTITRHFHRGLIRNKKLSNKSYMVDLADIPEQHRSKFFSP